MLLWHTGATIALARYAFRDERMDLRFLILGALLPDLIDTPLGLLWYSRLGAVRLAGHSLLFAGGLMIWIVVATRRGRPRKQWMPIAIGVLFHLFLDAMWANPETLWWPAFGFGFTAAGAPNVAAYISDVLRDPWMWLGEALGLWYLVVMVRRAQLGLADRRAAFLATGRIDVAIGFTNR